MYGSGRPYEYALYIALLRWSRRRASAKIENNCAMHLERPSSSQEPTLGARSSAV